MAREHGEQARWAASAVLTVGAVCVLAALAWINLVSRPGLEATAAASVGGRWACEMGCEGKKTYQGKGVCPVCRMALTRVSERPYVVMVSAPEPAVPGEPTTVRVQLLDPAGRPATALDSGGGHPVLLAFVSEDLAWTQTEVPSLDAEASTVVKVMFPSAGRYEVYADFRPEGLARQTPVAAFRVGDGAGAAAPVQLREDFDVVMTRDDYEFRIRCNGTPFVAGGASYLRFGVDKDGESIGDFAPILSEPAHALILRLNPRQVVMTHAMSVAPFLSTSHDASAADPNAHIHQHHAQGAGSKGALPVILTNSKPTDVVVQAVFPEPGLYRVIACFDHRGRLLAVPFTIDAQPVEPASHEAAVGGSNAP